MILHLFIFITLFNTHASGIPDAILGQPFSSARAVGQDVLIPKCPAHFCNGTEAKDQLCGCDKECYKRRDCCLDALNDEDVGRLLENDLWACVTTPRGLGPYSLIGRCPKNWTNDVVRKGCEGATNLSEDPNSALMVSSTLTNVTYKNIYCGQCNEGGIKPGHFHLRFKCNGKNVSSVPDALKDDTCDAYVDEEHVTFCEKMEKTVTTCPNSWSHSNVTYAREVNWRCESYFAPITLSEKRYKNIFCALCNNSSMNIEDVVCRNSYYPIEQEFILQLDGEFGAGTLIPGSGGKLCSRGEVYDPFQKSCRRVMCKKLEDCNVTETPAWVDVPLVHSASPCNMTFLNLSRVTSGSDDVITINDSPVSYRKGEYEKVKLRNQTEDSILLCSRSSQNGIVLFPQHFCERRHLLGYGSCGCEADCVQSRSCCLDAFDDATVDAFRNVEAWLCLNDTHGSSAVAKCPPDFQDAAVKQNCEEIKPLEDDPLLHVPVFSWEHSTLYRNVFCSVCNGGTNVTFHNLHFLCAEHSKLRNGWQAAEVFSKKPGLCSLQMELANSELPVKQCIRDKFCRQCPEEWDVAKTPQGASLKWRCERFYAPVDINGICYRNDFCAMCNGKIPGDAKNHRTFSNSLMSSRGISSQDKKSIFTTFTVG